MLYISNYISPIGEIMIISKNNELIGLQFKDSQNKCLTEKFKENAKDKIIIKTKKWLNDYFAGKRPNIRNLKFNPAGTDFQKQVWQILLKIPYGKVTTYKDVAQKLMQEKKISSISYQAVGQAIAKNPILIIIPCHRVIGSNNKLIGYKGGLNRKSFLLNHEKNYFKP